MDNDNQNISVIDFNKICRVCMSEGDLVNIFTDYKSDDSLFEMLVSCTLAMVSLKDELPDQICLQCLAELKVAYKFYKKAEISDTRLNKLLEISKQTDQVESSPSMSSIIQLKEKSKQPNQVKKKHVKNKVQLQKDKLEISTIENDESVSVNLESDTVFANYVQNDHDYVIFENICEQETSTSSEYVLDSIETNSDTDIIANFSKPSNRSTYECSECSQTGFNYRQLRAHWMTVHDTKCDERECEVCNKLIASKEFNQHIESHPQYKPFPCDLCDRKFKSEANLLSHKVSHLTVKPYKCPKCDAQFSRLGSLQKHIKKQSCRLPPRKNSRTADGYQCRVCDRCFPSKSGLYQHALYHGDKKYLCAYCGKSFTTGGSLSSHVKIHTGVKPYQCSSCPKTFSHSSSLKLHTLTHTGEKPFICEFCSKSFAQIAHLKYHIRLHTGERPHKCSHCEKGFADGSRLKIHMRTHTGETPHACEVCGRGFRDITYMRRHMKIHAKKQDKLN